MRARVAALFGFLAAACNDEQLGALGTVAGGGEGGGGGQGGEHPGEPELVQVPQWMVAETASGTDLVLPAIEAGTFVLPPAGPYLDLAWQPLTPGPNGQLVESFADLVYAAAIVPIDPGKRAFARGDTVATFYVDNRFRQPGDFYHSGRMRVPLGASDEGSLVVARALGRRNVPEVQIWQTDAEVVFNPGDVTAPDLVEGATDPVWLGVPLLVLGDEPLTDVTARVVESGAWVGTEVAYPSLAARSVTQLGFDLQPAAAPSVGKVPVTLRIESPSLAFTYDAELSIDVVADGARFRHTRRSNVDRSIQYTAVMPPADPQPDTSYGLILSLHGASVEATGQAAAYSPKDWAYLVAATNRRPYGFDWEEWGRLDALEALDDALAAFPIDPLRVHLTGHSMGGHGSWHVGVHFTERFGVVAPSAGWISFDLYVGAQNPPPPVPVQRARAASQTLDYVENFAQSSVYIIHGSADDNVPVSHARQMSQVLQPIAPQLSYHEEPGAGHWWDVDPEEGADCVDWEPMIATMEATVRDPLPLELAWRSPAPWVAASRSFVTVRSAIDPLADVAVASSQNGSSLTVTTENVRSMTLAASRLSGIDTIVVDGVPYDATGGDIAIGPATGKTPEQYGPLNQVFHRPFCWVWDDAGPAAYRDYASWLTSWWSVIGNGHACGVPLSRRDEVAASHNLIYLGVPRGAVAAPLPIAWDATGVTVGATRFDGAAVFFVYPDGDRLAAYVAAPEGSEHLLYRWLPFTSRSGEPDFVVRDGGGRVASGFFDADWQIDPAMAEGL
jgi:poly(3-hydroxybutyrate) depolymerase